MGGSKRMSKEEKAKTVLGIYHRTKQVYTEKEIVTLAAKEGVNANTIVDINTGLVDDGLVDKAKIGGSNYFWSFPAKKQRQKEIQYEKAVSSIETMKVKVDDAASRLQDAKRGREDDDGERSKKLRRIEELDKEKKSLQVELEALKENDPAAIADLRKELRLVTEAANRWTDNIFECHSWLTKKKGQDKKTANKYLGISEDFDYPEEPQELKPKPKKSKL